MALYLGRSGDSFRVEPYPHFVPDLIVEVLSASTAAEDRGPKKLEFQVVGVREYYLLDPNSGAVEAYRLAGGSYVELPRAKGGFASEVLGQIWDPASVLI